MAKYRYSKNSSPFDEAKNMYMLIGVCAVVVIIALILCLTLQGGSDEPDIPVVEQGDGTELPDFSDEPEYIGDIVVDDGGTPVEEFTVTMTGADGLYQREEGATLTVSGQNSESFSFVLTLPEGALTDTAYFNGERTAVCEKADGSLSFAFDAGAVYVTPSGIISELGGSSAEGLFALIEAAPTTSTESTAATTTTAADSPSGTYDLDIIKSGEVQSVLKGMLSASDYQLVTELLDSQGGYGIIYGTGDSSREKQGRAFNYDSQMDAILYYSFESGTGREVVVLCAAGARVYAGVCDGSEYRYYTNDAARTSVDDAPNYIEQYAKIKGMTLVGQ